MHCYGCVQSHTLQVVITVVFTKEMKGQCLCPTCCHSQLVLFEVLPSNLSVPVFSQEIVSTSKSFFRLQASRNTSNRRRLHYFARSPDCPRTKSGKPPGRVCHGLGTVEAGCRRRLPRRRLTRALEGFLFSDDAVSLK